MSDHIERACTDCGSLLHHEDDCYTNERTVRTYEGHSFAGHLLDNSIWRSRLLGRTIEDVLVEDSSGGCILVLDDSSFFSIYFSGDRVEVVGSEVEFVE